MVKPILVARAGRTPKELLDLNLSLLRKDVMDVQAMFKPTDEEIRRWGVREVDNWDSMPKFEGELNKDNAVERFQRVMGWFSGKVLSVYDLSRRLDFLPAKDEMRNGARSITPYDFPKIIKPLPLNQDSEYVLDVPPSDVHYIHQQHRYERILGCCLAFAKEPDEPNSRIEHYWNLREYFGHTSDNQTSSETPTWWMGLAMVFPKPEYGSPFLALQAVHSATAVEDYSPTRFQNTDRAVLAGPLSVLISRGVGAESLGMFSRHIQLDKWKKDYESPLYPRSKVLAESCRNSSATIFDLTEYHQKMTALNSEKTE